MKHSTVKVGAAAMYLAALPFVRHPCPGSAPRMLVTTELANAVAAAVSVAETEDEKDVYKVAIDRIDHRVKNGWIACPKKEDCARAMQRAWEQATGERHAT